MSFVSRKPPLKYYPKQINTLGDHIRKRRLDLKLTQREAAGKIETSEANIYNWERQRTLPEIRFIAPIINFLGYDPFPTPETFPEKLKTFRRKNGLSQKKLAAKLGIAPGTIMHWEQGKHKPAKAYLEKIALVRKFLIDSKINSSGRNIS